MITFVPSCPTTSVSVRQVLQTLGTETYRPSSASQCVAGIACAEIPVNQWPELIPQLVANVTDPSSTEHMKESTLEAIGYICQDIVSDAKTEKQIHEASVRLLFYKQNIRVRIQISEWKE